MLLASVTFTATLAKGLLVAESMTFPAINPDGAALTITVTGLSPPSIERVTVSITVRPKQSLTTTVKVTANPFVKPGVELSNETVPLPSVVPEGPGEGAPV